MIDLFAYVLNVRLCIFPLKWKGYTYRPTKPGRPTKKNVWISWQEVFFSKNSSLICFHPGCNSFLLINAGCNSFLLMSTCNVYEGRSWY